MNYWLQLSFAQAGTKISWSTKKQQTRVISKSEVEYQKITAVAQQVNISLQSLINVMGVKSKGQPTSKRTTRNATVIFAEAIEAHRYELPEQRA